MARLEIWAPDDAYLPAEFLAQVSVHFAALCEQVTIAPRLHVVKLGSSVVRGRQHDHVTLEINRKPENPNPCWMAITGWNEAKMNRSLKVRLGLVRTTWIKYPVN